MLCSLNMSLVTFRRNTAGMQSSLFFVSSDNCTSQYCCQYIFPIYAELAKTIGKPVLVYYGVNGHRKGLVDAMSGFGVKTILSRAIVTDDFYYNTDEELCTFLRTQKSSQKFYYNTLPSDILDKEMVNYRESSLVIPGMDI